MKRKVWGFYEMDFSELSGETIEQQKKRMSQLFIMKAYSKYFRSGKASFISYLSSIMALQNPIILPFMRAQIIVPALTPSKCRKPKNKKERATAIVQEIQS